MSATLASFAITATAVVNRPPVIGGKPVTTAGTGQPYSFRPTASDADGDPLTFTVTNKPAWASFDTANGTLYGTPTTSGTFANIVIRVSDGKASASLPAFAIAVTANPTRSVTVSWRAPTTNTDGKPLTGLTGFRVFAGTTPGQYSQVVEVPNPAVRPPSWLAWQPGTGGTSSSPLSTAAASKAGIRRKSASASELS